MCSALVLWEVYEEISAPRGNLPISKPPRNLLVSKKNLENKVGKPGLFELLTFAHQIRENAIFGNTGQDLGKFCNFVVIV